MRTLPVLLAAAASVALVALSSSASAQEGSFGYRYPNAFTAENLVGFGWDREKVEGEDASTYMVIGQLSPLQQVGRAVPARVGYHRFVTDGLSLGLLGSYLDTGASMESYMVGPRVGYSVPLGTDMSLWLRGGVNYTKSHLGAGFASLDTWNFLATGDLLFVYTPVPHVGLIFGAIAEFGLAGERTAKVGNPFGGGTGTESRSDDVRQIFIAGTMGLLLDF